LVNNNASSRAFPPPPKSRHTGFIYTTDNYTSAF
jgi:hypothetical protein